jgi:hypothetical protein
MHEFSCRYLRSELLLPTLRSPFLDLNYLSTVPVSLGLLNINIQDVPIADDYYVIFLNMSEGIIYSLSSKFTITNSSSDANGQSESDNPTASIKGAPTPTETWALAFDESGSVIGTAMGRSTLVPQWWIGALALVGAGAVSLL